MSTDRLAVTLLCAVLGGCATELDVPAYESDYTRQGATMVPTACLGQAEPGPNETLRLPMGCANSLNLQRMAERSADLQQGRTMGPTLSAPLGRAAERYILGEQAPLGPPPATTSEVPVQP